MRVAIVRDGVVENVAVVVASSSWNPPPGTNAVDVDGQDVGPGWAYDGQQFAPPAEPTPSPDPNGFLAAGRDKYGAAFWLTLPFPGVAFILEALNKGDWPSVRLGMDAMLQAEVITSEQHERLHELLDEYGIPPLVAEG